MADVRGIRFWVSTASLLLALALPAAARAAEWTLVDLGTLGGPGSYGAAVSAGGAVVGCSDTAAGGIHAFLYRDGVMRDLGTGTASGEGNSCALAVNDDGLAAGRTATGELALWQGNGVTLLGFPGDIGGMNAAGAVVGTRYLGDTIRAFLYSGGVVTDLGDGGARSEAKAINAGGQVVGSANGRAFLWEGGALRDLGTLGGNHSAARGINARGDVVGMSTNAFAQPTPFLHDGAMRELPGPSYSSAIAINARGQVVGSGEGIHGWLIDGGALVRLSELPAVVAKGWRRLEPTGINDRGWIVGTGENAAGDLRAFLLLPAIGKRRVVTGAP